MKRLLEFMSKAKENLVIQGVFTGISLLLVVGIIAPPLFKFLRWWTDVWKF
ncbi:MAG: hypothetical protein P0Y63_24815 [Klebsiella huaxiensis]|uniref:hypothetical protein n=1 Tax=Klebsiella huaxiensis TaxID=2153354 RepID=UPI0026EC4A1B|nr:hypothetical protein [Klebsiella huaxiensis]WEJ88467.1 MAG: hypothetical protein P0Y63_24815 [Klebsiella huaxiensis]